MKMTNLKILNAENAYKSGIDYRNEQRCKCGPMPQAIYKLKECQSNFHSYRNELSVIGALCRGGNSNPYELRHCVMEDKSDWSKEVPNLIAHGLGQNLIGVLEGLKGDGLSDNDIRQVENFICPRVTQLIPFAEQARIQLESNWPRVSMQLGTGTCLMDRLADDACSLIDDVVQMVHNASSNAS